MESSAKKIHDYDAEELRVPKNIKNRFLKLFEKVKIPVFLFMVYSILGWILEVVIFLVNEHKFVNRGFLIGPYCSIYGYGCLIVTYGLKKYRKEPVKLFGISVVLCSVIEYITSYAMEVLFGGRWWDYSQNSLELNGRVWLVTSIMFGVLVCLIIYFLRPFLIKCIRKISRKVVSIIVATFAVIYIFDNVICFMNVINLKEKFAYFEEDCTSQVSDYVIEKIKDIIK